MKKILYLSFLLTFFLSSAQTYSWQWAKTGGGTNGSSGTGFNQFEDEHILDMVVDNQNNTYYLVALYDGNPLLDGQSVTHYAGRDLLIFSTDCQGNLRWTRTIGGYGNAGQAQKIVLDNNGGLYLSISIGSISSQVSTIPTTFGTNNTLPFADGDPFVADVAWRFGFLLKYNTDTGDIEWRRDFQGDVSIVNNSMDMSPPVIDSAGNIHVIVGFKTGSHLNGLVTVPASYDASTPNFQYYLVKYDPNGNIIGVPSLLPLEGSTTFQGGYLNFMFDEANSRYYLAGSRNYAGNTPRALSYDGNPLNMYAFVLAFDATNFSELWRKEINNGTPNASSDYIFGLKKDPTTHHIYISGRFFKGSFSNIGSFGSYNFVTPLIGQISFVMKLDSSGNVVWCTNPVALSDGGLDAAMLNARMPIALKGNEILFAKGSIREVWGAFPMVRPSNDRTDPLLVKLNKDTGVVTGTHEVLGSYGAEDHFTAVAVDMDNNIMLGGFINQQLFTDPNDNIPTISNVSATTKTNFFYAKLATGSTCTQMATAETPVKETDLVFYPNPVDDVLQIKTKEKLETYQILSAGGRVVGSGAFTGSNYTVKMQGLAKGIYYVKVTGEKFSTAGKIIKK